MAPRPGTRHVKSLLSDFDKNHSDSLLVKLLFIDDYSSSHIYREALSLKESLPNAKDLTKLDSSVRLLISNLKSQTNPNPHKTLQTLMKWKLARGKFRGSLVKYQNMLNVKQTNQVIEKILNLSPIMNMTSKSLKHDGGKKRKRTGDDDSLKKKDELNKISCVTAMKSLISLSGVGPATASLFVSFFFDDCPFMEDHVMETFLHERKYQMKHFLLLRDALLEHRTEVMKYTKKYCSFQSLIDIYFSVATLGYDKVVDLANSKKLNKRRKK